MTRRDASEDQAIDPGTAAARRSAAQRLQGVVVLATPYAQQAAGRVVPLARTAGQRGAQSAQGALKAVGPRLDDAYVKLTPVVLAARGKVDQELLPRVNEAWVAAAGSPVLIEATKRGRAAMAAARGDLLLPEVPVAKVRLWPKRLAVFAGAAGVGLLAARKLLGAQSKGGGGRFATPSPDSAVSTADPRPAAAAETKVQPGGARPGTEPVKAPSGTGTYVGTEPPAGYEIKGDATSKTYRAPGSPGYPAAAGDVWFDSEDAARQAGFSPTQD